MTLNFIRHITSVIGWNPATVAAELFSEVAVVLNDTIAESEGAAADIFDDFEPEIKTLTEDQADPAILEERCMQI